MSPLASAARVEPVGAPVASGALAERPALVLLHGWGANERVWRPLAPALRERYTLFAPRLSSAPDPLEAMLDELPERAIYVGWSLGGLLGMRLAAERPERVAALVCVASNPCFVRRPGWTAGMPARDFAAFESLLARDAAAAMRRFHGLMAQGEPEPKACMRALRGALAGAPLLSAQLELLRRWDLRDALARIGMPCMHVLGARDALVPASLVETLSAHHRVAVLEGAGHVPFLSRPAAWLALFDAFVADHFGPPSPPLDKSRVAIGFARAARSYDGADGLQREAGRALLRWSEPPPDSVAAAPSADLGCGTGAWVSALAARRPGAGVVGIDIACPMLERARERADAMWLCADAERLALRDGALGMVWSNLALQWCADLPGLMAELWRVLAPGGRLAFSVLGPDSLWELRGAWRALDDGEHVRRFCAWRAWRDAASQAGFEGIEQRGERKVRRYAGLRELVGELRALGVSNRARLGTGGPSGPSGPSGLSAPGASWDSGGLAGRRRWQALESNYRNLCAGDVTASWQIFYARMRKPR